MITVGAFAAAFDEQGRVLCVRHERRDQLWGMPGGKLDPGEDPVTAVKREAMEEAACRIEVEAFVGVYSAVYKDDLVLLFTARVVEQLPWKANDEICDVGFFPLNGLPEPMHENPRLRFRDVAEGRSGILSALSAPGEVIAEASLRRSGGR